MFFSERNFHELVIHEAGVNLIRGEILLDYREPDNPMSILWDSIESLRCFPTMQSLLPRSISYIICL